MPQPPSGKPSLIDTSPTGAPAHEADTSIRMLDALQPNARATSGTPGRRGFGWSAGLLLLLVACGASWFWWSQRVRANDSAEHVAQASAPPPAAAASGVVELPSAATIVAAPEAAAPSAVPTTMAASASVPLAAASPSSSAASAVTQRAEAEPAKPKASSPTRETRVAADANADRKRAAQGTKPADRSNSAAGPNSDPDVALLSAMLATMARGGPDGPPSQQAQLTIAQLVQRCELRGVKDAISTFECKRRICDGYWGKADACPMSLSPKKN